MYRVVQKQQSVCKKSATCISLGSVADISTIDDVCVCVCAHCVAAASIT